MANEEQLAILRQGVDVWNRWRENNPWTKIDLSGANLQNIYLKNVHLHGANLGSVNLRGANLSNAMLGASKLGAANLASTNLTKASLYSINFWTTELSHADLKSADITQASFQGSNLKGTDFAYATMGDTIFAGVDLSTSIGLEKSRHMLPSTIGTDTLQLSNGNIPMEFLRGCGLSDWEIEQVKLYNPGLNNEEINNIQYKMYDLRATQAIQISPLFISYSHGDSSFVDKIETQLNNKGIRFWRDIHDMKAGRIEKQIDSAISQGRTVLLVLSEHSLNSDWVEHEVRTARQLEKDIERDVLCPVALDDSWKSSRWPKRIMEQIMEYNILEFSAWEDDVKFEEMFRRLIDGLQLFYKG